MRLLTKSLLAFLALNLACSPATRERSSSPESSRRKPTLCDIDRGRYCSPEPSGPGDVQAPASEDAGWVCCAPQGTPCVAVSDYSECTFVGGWCFYYTTNADDTVTCYD